MQCRYVNATLIKQAVIKKFFVLTKIIFTFNLTKPKIFSTIAISTDGEVTAKILLSNATALGEKITTIQQGGEVRILHEPTGSKFYRAEKFV